MNPSSRGARTGDGSAPSSGSPGPDGGGDRKHVRFSSLDLVHNLARRVSAGLNNNGGDGGDGGNDDENQNEHTGSAAIDDAALNSSEDFFIDKFLAAELNQEAAARTASASEALQSPSPVGNKGSVIFWRGLPTPRSSNKGSGSYRKKENTPASRLPMRYRKEAATLLVLTAVATEFIGISISLPVLISYASSFGVPERLTGLVFSVGGFSTFLSNLWIPIRSDAIGRKQIILATLCGSCVAYVLEASARTFEMLLLGVFLGGFFGGTQPVAVAYISDIYSPQERPRFIGMVPACASVCFTMGPALGGYLSSATGSYRSPLIFASVVVASFLPVMIYFLPESRDILSKAEREKIRMLELQQPERKEGKMTYDRRTTYASTSLSSTNFLSEASPLVPAAKKVYLGPHRDIRCYGCLFIELCRTLAFSGFVTTLPLVLRHEDFGLNDDQQAVLWTGIVIGVASGVKSIGLFVLFDRIQKRIGLVECIVLGSIAGLAAFLILMFTGKNSILLMAVGFSIFCFGSAMVQPGNFSFVTLLVPHEFTARAVAMPNVATSLGQTVAPIAGSALLYATSYKFLYLIGTILMAAQLLTSLAFLAERRKKEGGETVHTDSEEDEEEDGDDTEEKIVPVDEYEDILTSTLLQLLSDRNYDLRNAKAQQVVLEILGKSFPYLRDEGEANERDLDKLIIELSIMRGKKKSVKMQRENSLLRSSVGIASLSTTW